VLRIQGTRGSKALQDLASGCVFLGVPLGRWSTICLGRGYRLTPRPGPSLWLWAGSCPGWEPKGLAHLCHQMLSSPEAVYTVPCSPRAGVGMGPIYHEFSGFWSYLQGCQTLDLHLFFAERVTFCSLLPLLPAFVGGNICIFNGSLSRVHTWDCSYCHEKRTQLFPLGNLWDWLSGESSHGGDSEHERPPLRLGLAGL
jgi:hypothetical protein